MCVSNMKEIPTLFPKSAQETQRGQTDIRGTVLLLDNKLCTRPLVGYNY